MSKKAEITLIHIITLAIIVSMVSLDLLYYLK